MAAFAEQNRNFYNGLAGSFEIPLVLDGVRKEVEAILRLQGTYLTTESEILDFGCGTGLVSLNLLGKVKSLFGMDISEEMVKRYNERAKALNKTPEEMQAICLNLRGEPGELDDRRFDAIVACMVFHHFEDIAALSKTLGYFLKPGGALLVTDWTTPPPRMAEKLKAGGPAAEITAHASFSKEDLETAFGAAGLTDIQFDEVTGEMKSFDEEPLPFFVAKGVKAT